MASIKDLLITRVEINALKDQQDSKIDVALFKSVRQDDAYFCVRVSDESSASEFRCCDEYGQISNAFIFERELVLESKNPWKDIDCEKLIGNYGALMHHSSYKFPYPTPRRIHLTVEKDTVWRAIYKSLYLSSRDEGSVAFVGSSKDRYNDITKKKYTGGFFGSSCTDILNHYFDNIRAMSNDGKEVTEDECLKDIDELVNHILQGMETDLGDRMPFWVDINDTWDSIMKKAQQPIEAVTNIEEKEMDKTVTNEASEPEINVMTVNPNSVVDGDASSLQAVPYPELYELLRKYLKNELYMVQATRGINLAFGQLDNIVSSDQWVTLVKMLDGENSDVAIELLQKCCTLEPGVSVEPLEKRLARVESFSVSFREFTRKQLPKDFLPMSQESYCYLNYEAAKEVVETLCVLMAK